jgi:hypothetical protein
MFKEQHRLLQEYFKETIQKWYGLYTMLISIFIFLVTAILALIHVWSNIPIWNLISVMFGTSLFLIMNILAFSRIIKERDKLKGQIQKGNYDYSQIQLEHWKKLASLAQNAIEDINLPLISPWWPASASIPNLSTGQIEETKVIEFQTQFQQRSTTWYFDNHSIVILPSEHKYLWDCLVEHLKAEYSNFDNDLKQWHVTCTEYFYKKQSLENLKHITQTITDKLELVSIRETFIAKCKVCEKW